MTYTTPPRLNGVQQETTHPMGTVYRHLYDQVCDWENLLLAWRKARQGKRGHAPAAAFEQRAGEH